MKIISKYKDFYDYLTQDYDADIVYSRIAKWTGDLRLSRKLYMGISSYWSSAEPNKLHYVDPEITWCRAKIGDFDVSGIVFGVYPFVYSAPTFNIFGQDDCNGDVWKYPTPIYLGRSFVESLENEDSGKRKKIASKFIRDIIKDRNRNTKNWLKLYEGEYTFYFRNDIDILDVIKSYARKIECQEIFETLGSPVFIEENDLINFFHTPFPTKDLREKKKQYLVDLSLITLNSSIIKYWYNDLYDLRTYNYIENFLWSIKQEPQPVQTNNEKILSHGFDLKTSFRKV